MSSETQAEIEKLARLLQTEPAALAFLEGVDAADLRTLRDQATERLFASGAHIFDRLKAAARMVPSQVAASISQRAFGPLLTAKMASTVDPGSAIGVAKRLPPEFLADVAAEMDPRRAPEVIAGLEPELIASSSRELAKRGDWVAMGRFVGELDDAQLTATLEVLDDEAVMRIGFVTEDRERIPAVFALLGENRIERMRKKFAGDPEMERFAREVLGWRD